MTPKTINDVTVAEAIAAMDGMLLDEAEAFARGDTSNRAGIAKYIEERRAKLADRPMPQTKREGPSKGDQPATEPLVFAAYPGSPGMLTLRPTRLLPDPKTRELYPVGGIVLQMKQTYHADPGIRRIDIKLMPEVARPQFPVAPAEIANLIMDTRYFQQGLIVPWDEYIERKAMREQKANEMDRVEKDFERRMAEKRGKRGIAATARVEASQGAADDNTTAL